MDPVNVHDAGSVFESRYMKWNNTTPSNSQKTQTLFWYPIQTYFIDFLSEKKVNIQN